MKKRWLILPLVVLLALLWGSAYAQDEADWTILWYLCGTDLESDDGSATYNLEQAMAGKTTDNANMIIVTGGTNEWQNEIISSDEIGVYRLSSNGKGGGLYEDFEPKGSEHGGRRPAYLDDTGDLCAVSVST